MTGKISQQDRVCIIAGGGMLPVSMAQKLKDEKLEAFALGFIGITDKILKKYVKELILFELGKIGPVMEYLKSRNINKALLGGQVKHDSIFRGLRLDDAGKTLFAKMKDRRADSILGIFAEELKSHNIELLSALDVIPENILGEGVATKARPDNLQYEDIRFGARIAKGLSGLDIGQTVVVKDKAVIAVEGMEGTDKCILRAGELAGAGTVIVKVAKPNQDTRFDMPVLGPRTIKMMKKAGSKILAAEAGKTIILERTKALELADRYGLVIAGMGNE